DGQDIINLIIDPLETFVFQDIANAAAGLTSAFLPIFQWVREIGNQIVIDVSDYFSQAFDWINHVISPVVSDVVNAFAGLLGIAGSFVGGFGTTLLDSIDYLIKQAVAAVATGGADILAVLKPITDPITNGILYISTS